MAEGADDEVLVALARQVGQVLEPKSLLLTTAESCTGGWVAKLLTDIVGSSAWYERGFVTYSNASKQELLGVDPAIIQEHGAVSEETVRAMAQGALQHSRADLSLAITGIAGPSGGTPFKPVGLVWFAWADKAADSNEIAAIYSQQQIYKGDRDAVRRQAVANALTVILERLRD